MKNFKATIVPVRLKTTRTGTYAYYVRGSKQALEFYLEQQGEQCIIDDATEEPLFFTKNLYAFGGMLSFNEEYDRFISEPNIQSALAVQAMAVNMSFNNSGSNSNSKSNDDLDEEEEEISEPKLEKPKGKRGSLK